MNKNKRIFVIIKNCYLIFSLANQREQYLKTKAEQISSYQNALSTQVLKLFCFIYKQVHKIKTTLRKKLKMVLKLFCFLTTHFEHKIYFYLV